MKQYKLHAAVWQDGSGWQPHEIADRTAESEEEALEIANKLVVIGAMLGDVIITITSPDGTKIEVKK